MSSKAQRNETYERHGAGVDTLSIGFDELVMPHERRSMAIDIVRELLAANGASVLKWYMTAKTPEIACYWDDHEQNLLWITNTELHVMADSAIAALPDRPLSWEKQGGRYVGWLLPGASSGTGGGKRNTAVATVLCPEQFVQVPADAACDYCEVFHT